MATVDITRIASNIGASNALNSLQNINKQLATHQTRLQTGKRINSAAEDPAGLTIATKLLARSEGLKTASSNIGDAQNMLGMAEFGLGKINDILVQMRNKAEQAASDTLGSKEREAIQTQLQNFAAGIDEIVNQNKWNGTKLLDGTISGLTFQTGVELGESNTWTLSQSHSASSLGVSKTGTGLTTLAGQVGGTDATVDATTAWVETTVGTETSVVKQNTTATNGMAAAVTGRYKVQVLDVADGNTAGVALNAKFTLGSDSSVSGSLTKNATGTNPAHELASGSYTMQITSSTGTTNNNTVAWQIMDGTTLVTIGTTNLTDNATAVAIADSTGTIGLSLNKAAGTTLSVNDGFTFDYMKGGDVKYQLLDSSNVAMSIDKDGTADTNGAAVSNGKVAYVAANAAALKNVDTGRGFTFNMGQFSAMAANQYFSFDFEESGDNIVNVSTASKAATYMDTISNAMDTVNKSQAGLGSLMARLDFKLDQINTQQVNVEASYSRIMNANMAEEQVNASKFSILQQTATAMLAQANQAPQSLLSLFR